MAFIAEFYRQPKVKPLALALIAAVEAEGASLHDLEEAYTVVIQEYRYAIKNSGEIITQFRGEVEGSFERAEKEIEALRRRGGEWDGVEKESGRSSGEAAATAEPGRSSAGDGGQRLQDH